VPASSLFGTLDMMDYETRSWWLALDQAGALQNSQSPEDAVNGRRWNYSGTRTIPALVNFAHFRKVNEQLEPS
jgi:hypothetical protein